MLPLLLALGGCDWSQLDEVHGDGAIPAVEGDRVIWTSPTQVARVAPPDWAAPEAAGAVQTLVGLAGDAVIGRACGGHGPTLQALESQLRTAEDGLGPVGWRVIQGCSAPAPAACAWIQERVDWTQPSHAQVWGRVATGCVDPAHASWLLGPNVPGEVQARFLARQDDQYRPIHAPQSLPALEQLLVRGAPTGHAAQALAAVDHPDHARVLLTLNQPHWLYRQSAPEARAGFLAWCDQQTEGTPWQCLEARALDHSEALTDTSVDLSAVLARFPDHRALLLDRLEDCLHRAAAYSEPRGDRCIRALAGAEEGWARVRSALDAEEDQLFASWVAPSVVARRFDSTLALRDDLVARGLVPPGTKALDPTEPPATPLGWMVDGERGLWIEGVPAEALRRVVARVPELADLVVAQRDPVFRSELDRSKDGDADTSEPVGPARRYVSVLVWDGAVRHRALFPLNGSIAIQLTGVMNTVAEARGVDVRFVAPEGWNAVIWGPEAALRSAVEDGLIQVRDRSMATEG